MQSTKIGKLSEKYLFLKDKYENFSFMFTVVKD